MKKNLYTILLTTTLVIAGLIFIFAKKPKKKIAAYKERIGAVALGAEWLNTKKAIESLLIEIELNPDNLEAKLNLARAYIQESRITGDHAYYDNTTLSLLDDILEVEPKNFDALCCKATVLLSQHHFTEALTTANEAAAINPNNAFVYGLLCDANVELGNYKEAVSMSDKMIGIRPDIRSYARVSYLREIHGDINGAIEACKLALASGYPGLEETEWSRMILAHLYEISGNLDTAQYHYQIALLERPNYPFAEAGLGKIEKIKGNYKAAIAHFEKANSNIIEYSFTDELTDLYRLNNEPEKAEASAKKVIDLLSPLSKDDESSNAHGHYADKELAYAYLKINDTQNALKHALLEYNRRPNNIEVCETLAWTYYRSNQLKEANTYIEKALLTQSKNPVLLCRAGLIKMKIGEKVKGMDLIALAFQSNPIIFDTDLKKELAPYVIKI
jgi:tetratricopeptide (TPR) repeat protein